MENLKKYRYPGISFFKSTDEDIYCGRKEDSQRLYTQIMLNDTMVLHAESGVGKSSLIRAGIIPLIDKNKSNYLPVTIKFGKKSFEEDYLVLDTLRQIRAQCPQYNNELPYLKPKENDLWYLAKKLEKNGHPLLLFFDQFEELRAFSYKQVNYFAKKLSELFNSNIPTDVDDEIEKNTKELFALKEISNEAREEYNLNTRFLEKPLQSKAVFVIREDKLGTMSLLSDYFPNILKNDFRILPLDLKNARKAIEEPAQKEGENYLSNRFKYKETVIEHLLESLTDPNTGRIDPIQIQIICSNIERTKSKHIKVITRKALPPIKNIISDFYAKNWKRAKDITNLNDDDFETKRKETLQHLIINEKRNLVHKDVLTKSASGEDYKIIKELTNSGLLIEVLQGNEIFYQLCHDRLVIPALDDLRHLEIIEESQLEKEELSAKTRKRIRTVSFSLLFLLLAVISVALFKLGKASDLAEEQYVISIAKTYKRSNPTFSYVIINNWLKDHKKYSPEFESFKNEFDSSSFSPMLTTIPFKPKLISIETENKDSSQITIRTANSISKWNIDNGILLEQTNLLGPQYIKKLVTKNNCYYAYREKNFLRIKDSTDATMAIKFPAKRFNINPDNLEIAYNGKYIVINHEIFNFETGKSIVKIPAPYKPFPKKNIFYRNPGVTHFLHNSNHIAVAYARGNIVIFKIKLDGNGNEDILELTAIYGRTGRYLPLTQLLAIDKEDKYLIAGNRYNQIMVWEIGELMENTVIEPNAHNYKKKPLKILEGHDGRITCLSVSDSGQYVLSGSKDNLAILWDIESGRNESILRGSNSAINAVGFLNSSNQMYTASENGIIYFWSRKKAEKKYMANISPLDYYIYGNDIMDAGEIYDTTSLQNFSAGLLHYIINIPYKNQFPEEANYLKSLEKSITEVDTLYYSLKRKENYEDSLNSAVKNLLNTHYYDLALRKPELLLKTQGESKEERFIRTADLIIKELELYLPDTSATNVVVDKTNKLMKIVRNLDNDSIYSKKVENYLIKTEEIASIYRQKYSDNNQVKQLWKNLISYYSYTSYKKEYSKVFDIKNLAIDLYPNDNSFVGDYSFWYSLSYNLLFEKEYERAIKAANISLELKPDITRVNTNLALAYLLKNDWEEAERIYRKYKDSLFYIGSRGRPSGYYFLKDILALESAGITHPDFEKVRALFKD